MKKKIIIIITCILLSVTSFAQINILKKITKKVEQKTEQKIDEDIDKGVNEVFEGQQENEKKAKNKKQVEDEGQAESDENTDGKKLTTESNSTSQSIEDQIKELLKSSELTRYTDIKKIFESYKTIDEAINQDSLNLLTEVLFSAPKKKNEHLQAEENRNEAPHIEEMLKEYQKELKEEIKGYFQLLNFLITKGAKVGYLNNDGNNTLTLFLKTIDPLRRLGTGIDIIQERDKIYELIIDKASGIDIIYAAQNIFELEFFKKAVDRAADINLVVETDHKQKRNALHYLIISLQDQKTQKVNINKAIYLLEKGIKVFENNWWKQNEDLGLIPSVLVFAGADFENSSILCKKLIEAGADVNLKVYNRTALYELPVFLFRPGGEELFKLVLEKGANVNYVFNKLTPLDRILPRLNSDNPEVKNKATRIVELLKSKGAKTFSELNQ